MYSPALSEKAVKTLYRLKQFYRKPMTEIAEDLLKKALATVDKELVCRECIGRRNNNCECCYLACSKERS